MSCKSAIYTANNTPATLAVGNTIPLGTIIRRFGQNINLNGDGITLTGQGYYDVDVSVTAEATAADVIGAALYANGVEVPGATASANAGAGETVALAFPALVRIACCGEGVTLTLRLTGAAATVSNVAMTVEKI